jgi:hypothetical protein
MHSKVENGSLLQGLLVGHVEGELSDRWMLGAVALGARRVSDLR